MSVSRTRLSASSKTSFINKRNVKIKIEELNLRYFVVQQYFVEQFE
jgi:hypothetical protein